MNKINFHKIKKNSQKSGKFFRMIQNRKPNSLEFDDSKINCFRFMDIEKKWQDKWEKEKIFEVNEKSSKTKYYILEQFPYPSGSGLHVGHSFIYTIGDIYARFKRMQKFNVLYPMGFDSFGLPAENAAIKAKSHPKKFTEDAIKNFIKQMKIFGYSYDWSRMIETHKPEFYKWDQWIFLKMFEKKLAYKKEASVNWCPKCNTVLANEQVINGKCWIHNETNIIVKKLNQWFLKITSYAEELLEELEKSEWPKFIKTAQRNWIGKSHGAEILFEIDGKKWPIFTTRPDTIYGVTFMVISAQHPKLMELVTKEQKKFIEKFLQKIKSTKQKDMEKLDKEGIFTGTYAINPINNDKVPIYAGNFVIADYGSGMIMAVPAHDERDFEFAKKYNLPIKQVIQKVENKEKNLTEAYTDSGKLINSGPFNDLDNEEAKEHILIALKEKNLAKKVIQYKLRDWLISRQRFWGTPIPIIYCDDCGIVPVPEKELPVKLPDNIKFNKTKNPLANYKPFLEAKCPNCGKKGKRETDTMDTFVNSSWYFLRYCDPHNNNKIFDEKKIEYWMPIDIYIGGREHATMHDIYFRFYTKFLRDLGLLKFNEPAKKLFNQGFILGEDGNKMSKSKGNVVSLKDAAEKYGVDAVRFFLVSVASPASDYSWSSSGANSSTKFIKKIIEYYNNVKISSKKDNKINSKLNKTIKEVTFDIENFKYNLATIKIRQLFSSFENENSKNVLENFLKILHPFCPHITEELWEKLGNKTFISLESWPIYSEKLIDDNIEKQEQIINNTLLDINNIINLIKEKQKKSVEKIYLYTLPNELLIFNEQKMSEKLGISVKIFAINDKNKYDPENKSKKAKPGKPGIYIE